ncbi:MAG: T9SS type A sorting domain-containing protein [Flavobacterium sp.]|uniref:T9SS type A sorting domain-containing protein n=1 Tax=Flavobacterium sp. TaxID=239 RepID=UPI0032639909
MKKLLLSSILLLGSLSSFAQDDCATPLTATLGTNTAPAIGGNFEAACFDITADNLGGPIYGLWYEYTATADGEVTVNSNLPINVAPNSDDTMVSVMTGTCGVLTCVASNDDVSGTNYLSSVTFPVAAGATYYIEWSNYWNGNGFDFDLSFTPISCLGVYGINPTSNITATSISLNWDASLSAPASYEVEYGPVGFVPGAGTTVTTTENTVNLTGLDASTVYDFYVRSDCGATQSTWTTANTFTTAKVLPYASGFDNTTTQLVGWTTSGNGAYGLSAIAGAANAHSPSFYWIFNNTVGAVSNNWLITPPISLQAGEQVTASFWIRCASLRSLRMTVGTTPTPAALTTLVWSNAALLATTYAQQTTPTWTAPATGTYYFGFNDVSAAAATTAATMRFDTVNFTSVLGTNDFLSSKFSVFPNPVSNVINFSNDQNAVVSTIELADLNGRVIKSMKVNATEGQISVSDLATGIYMMKITTDQGVAVKKVVKQ